jgi:hypothetical protein
VALAAYVLNNLVSQAGPDIVRRHWAGEEDVLEVVEKVLGVAERHLGGQVWQGIRRITKG